MKKVWKNFIAYDFELLRNDLETYFNQKKLSGSWKKVKGRWILSGHTGYCFTATSPIDFTITIYKATASPISRLMIQFVGGASTLEGVSFIEIKVPNGVHFTQVQDFIASFIKRLKISPWDFKKHPVFQVAWLLRRNVRKKWELFLKNTS